MQTKLLFVLAILSVLVTGAAPAKEFKPGVISLGLAEGGVDWARDEHNAGLVTDEMRSAVETAKAAIIAGKIVVHDYTSDSNCPG